MRLILTVLKHVPEVVTVLVGNNVPEASAVLSVVLIVPVPWVSSAREELVLPAAKQITIVPLINPVLMANAQIHVPIKKHVAAMLYVPFPSTACYAIALMVMKVSLVKSAYNSNVNVMKIVNQINAVIRANAVILAWNTVPVVLMLNVVWWIASLNVPVHRTSLVMLLPNAIP